MNFSRKAENKLLVVCEVVIGYLVQNIIYDRSVILTDFSLTSRAIFKDRRRKLKFVYN